MTAALLLAGCDPIARHKALTTVFDGVPSLPPPEELCQEYAEKLTKAATEKTETAAAPTPKNAGSIHPPFEEKRCTDCHASGGGVSSNLIKPKNELCFTCHPDILAFPRAHGPAAVGDCLACHHPHESGNSALLLKPRSEICGKCHQETRLAAAMHGRFTEKGMACPDCHDPHSGTSGYFLK